MHFGCSFPHYFGHLHIQYGFWAIKDLVHGVLRYSLVFVPHFVKNLNKSESVLILEGQRIKIPFDIVRFLFKNEYLDGLDLYSYLLKSG